MYWDVSRIPASQEPFTCSSDTLIATRTATPCFSCVPTILGLPNTLLQNRLLQSLSEKRLTQNLFTNSPLRTRPSVPSTSPTSQSPLLTFAQNSNAHSLLCDLHSLKVSSSSPRVIGHGVL